MNESLSAKTVEHICMDNSGYECSRTFKEINGSAMHMKADK